MTKPELQRIALKLFNQGILNPEEMYYCPELKTASNSDNKQCTSYPDELFRTGKTEFKKKYCIKN